jgi:RNA polymerase sigma-70 factor (ECF subfamily)
LDEKDLRTLAAAVQKGDERSFRKLVEALSRTLIAMAFRYTRDWEWAQDLTQETWLKVHDRIHRYDRTRSFTTWLYAVHRNGCLDHLRRPWVRRESTLDPGQIAEISGPGPEDPQEELERREFHGRIMEALGDLSETQRQVLVRVDLEQNDQKTVAEILGIKFGTLRTTLHFARKRLASALRELEKET